MPIPPKIALPEDILKARLERGELPPVLYLYGEDEGRVLALIDEVRRALVEEAASAFNVSTYDARESALERIFETARTLPMMSSRRLVVVANASALNNKGGWERMLPYLRDPAPLTCLVLRGDKAPGSQEAKGLLAEKGLVMELRPRSERQAEAWASERVRTEGKRLQPEAARALVERVGTRQGDLEGEIQKLLAFVGRELTIREEDVREVAAEARSRKIFDLTDAIGRRRTLEALGILHRLLEEGSAPLAILGMMARQVRLIWLARASLDRVPDDPDWGKGLPGPAFLREELLRQARNWDETQLTDALRGLARIDRELKTGRLSPEMVMTRWVVGVGSKRRGRKDRDVVPCQRR